MLHDASIVHLDATCEIDSAVEDSSSSSPVADLSAIVDACGARYLSDETGDVRIDCDTTIVSKPVTLKLGRIGGDAASSRKLSTIRVTQLLDDNEFRSPTVFDASFGRVEPIEVTMAGHRFSTSARLRSQF